MAPQKQIKQIRKKRLVVQTKWSSRSQTARYVARCSHFTWTILFVHILPEQCVCTISLEDFQGNFDSLLMHHNVCLPVTVTEHSDKCNTFWNYQQNGFIAICGQWAANTCIDCSDAYLFKVKFVLLSLSSVKLHDAITTCPSISNV